MLYNLLEIKQIQFWHSGMLGQDDQRWNVCGAKNCHLFAKWNQDG